MAHAPACTVHQLAALRDGRERDVVLGARHLVVDDARVLDRAEAELGELENGEAEARAADVGGRRGLDVVGVEQRLREVGRDDGLLHAAGRAGRHARVRRGVEQVGERVADFEQRGLRARQSEQRVVVDTAQLRLDVQRQLVDVEEVREARARIRGGSARRRRRWRRQR
jgi:hypothetical protein